MYRVFGNLFCYSINAPVVLYDPNGYSERAEVDDFTAFWMPVPVITPVQVVNNDIVSDILSACLLLIPIVNSVMLLENRESESADPIDINYEDVYLSQSTRKVHAQVQKINMKKGKKEKKQIKEGEKKGI